MNKSTDLQTLCSSHSLVYEISFNREQVDRLTRLCSSHLVAYETRFICEQVVSSYGS